MSWFGLGGGKKEPSPNVSSYSVEEQFPGSSSSYGGDSSSYAAPSQANLGAGSFEQELMMEQQKALVQAVVTRLTDLSFDTCVTKPGSSMSSSERNCIQSTVGKYLDTTELVVGRFNGQG